MKKLITLITVGISLALINPLVSQAGELGSHDLARPTQSINETRIQTYVAPNVASIPVSRDNYTVSVDNSEATIKAYARNLVGEAEFTCLDKLWEKESNWNYQAQNNAFSPRAAQIPEYQAYGIAQAGPGLKMSSFGADWKESPRTQISWGVDYIKRSYGTPCAAWSHSQANNWY